MVEWKKKSRRKTTGGINNSVNAKTKSLSDRGGSFSRTTVEEKDKRYKVRTRGGNHKIKLSKAVTVLVSDSGKTVKGKIISVLENKANKHFVRQKIITKGAILKVDLGGQEKKVIVTSRPGQSGQVSAVPFKK